MTIPKFVREAMVDQSDDMWSLTRTYYKEMAQLHTLRVRVRCAKKSTESALAAMQKACKHRWIKDTPTYQTPTSWTCNVCGADK